MKELKKRPVPDTWVGEKLGLQGGVIPDREQIEAYQLARLNTVLETAYTNSRFYRNLFGGRQQLTKLEDMRTLPLTTPEDLKENALQMLCVPPSEISRIVTLKTSGSSGAPKRVYFTPEDIELCVDFFHHGMLNLVDKSDKIAILFPSETPGSVGDCLKRGLGRIPAESFTLFEKLDDKNAVLSFMERQNVTSLIGAPSVIAELAVLCAGSHFRIPLRSVLLSSDFVSDYHRETIKSVWDCEIFEHYGLTESGFGLAVSCQHQEGYHVREADIYVEIVKHGKPVPDGESGEIVFTTLTRTGMPFIRYRTGDISKWINRQCRCGTVLRLLDKVSDRGLKKGGL